MDSYDGRLTARNFSKKEEKNWTDLSTHTYNYNDIAFKKKKKKQYEMRAHSKCKMANANAEWNTKMNNLNWFDLSFVSNFFCTVQTNIHVGVCVLRMYNLFVSVHSLIQKMPLYNLATTHKKKESERKKERKRIASCCCSLVTGYSDAFSLTCVRSALVYIWTFLLQQQCSTTTFLPAVKLCPMFAYIYYMYI